MPLSSGPALARACLRWDAAGDRALRALGESDWRALMDTIRQRDGQALMARRLSRLPDVLVPEHVARELHDFRRDVAIRALAGLARLSPAIAKAGVPVMALKGLDLGTRLYEDLGARPIGDMDLLVRPAHVGTMADALRAQGFRTSRIARQSTHHLTFYSPLPGGLPVELHWAFGADDGRAGRSPVLEGVWDDAVPIEVSGVPLLAPHRRRLLPILCSHLERHLFETPLTNIWDIAEFLEREGDGFDWDDFWARCDRHGLRRGAEAALGLVAICLGVATPAKPLPAQVRDLLPDVVSNLGHHPRKDIGEPGISLALLSDPHTRWSVRWRVLADAFFPSRHMVAAGGAGGAGPAAYLQLWRTLFAYYLRNRGAPRSASTQVQVRVAKRTRLHRWLG